MLFVQQWGGLLVGRMVRSAGSGSLNGDSDERDVACLWSAGDAQVRSSMLVCTTCSIQRHSKGRGDITLLTAFPLLADRRWC